jgi:hypothetical protein
VDDHVQVGSFDDGGCWSVLKEGAAKHGGWPITAPLRLLPSLPSLQAPQTHRGVMAETLYVLHPRQTLKSHPIRAPIASGSTSTTAGSLAPWLPGCPAPCLPSGAHAAATTPSPRLCCLSAAVLAITPSLRLSCWTAPDTPKSP